MECAYCGYWYCIDCMANNKKPIAYKVLENFDFNEYPVCKESFDEINILYYYPVIIFNYTDNIVRTTPKLFKFLVLKR